MLLAGSDDDSGTSDTSRQAVLTIAALAMLAGSDGNSGTSDTGRQS
jgi:hypothetical protein